MAKKKNKKQNNTANSNPQDLKLYERAVQDARLAVKRADKKLLKSVSVPKGTQYDWLNNSNFNNVVYPQDKIPDRLLRLVERRNGIVGGIIKLRKQQALEFSHISHNKDIPGWEVVLKDQDAKITPEQKKQKEFLEDFIKNLQVKDYTPVDGLCNSDTFRSSITKFMRDRILIDKIVWELERNNRGEVISVWILDGATIMPVLPGGFYGSTSQVGVGISRGYNKLGEAIRKAKIEQIPPVEEIAYIQELIYGNSGGGITAAFRESDLIYDLGDELNDIQYYKQGLSATEKANIAIVAFINSLTYNSNGLSRGAIPKVAVAMGKDSNYTEDQLEDMQDEWAANFEAMDGQWNIPILNGDAKILNMLPNNRDMEYQKYMEFTGALTCAIMGVDSAELGLRLNQAQAVLSENQDGKQIFSKNRGVREHLGEYAYIWNQVLDKSGYEFAKDFLFRFNGLSNSDKSYEADLRKKDVETYKTVDEIRIENDDDPLPNGLGNIILNPVFLQNKQAIEQQQQQQSEMEDQEEGFGGFSEEETDDMVDEVMSEMSKGVRLL